jgi:hypothetical protein
MFFFLQMIVIPDGDECSPAAEEKQYVPALKESSSKKMLGQSYANKGVFRSEWVREILNCGISFLSTSTKM